MESKSIEMEEDNTPVMGAEVGVTSEAAYVAAARALEHQARPPYVLRLLMRGLEGYRSQRKMGWSRPQNKYGVCTYRSYSLDRTDDAELIFAALRCVRTELSGMPSEQSEFVSELMGDPQLMGFVFCQDLVEGEQRYETVTASFGRVSSVSRRFRDRLDVILDSNVHDGHRVGLARLRVFVDPFQQPIAAHTPWSAVVDGPRAAGTERLLEQLAAFDRRFEANAEKRWDHWTSRYVEYFGPRQHRVEGSMFPDDIDRPAVALPSRLERARSAPAQPSGASR